jgi:hypothetical protein
LRKEYPKLDITDISDAEAALQRCQRITTMTMTSGDKEIQFVGLSPDGIKTVYRYKLSEAIKHIEAYLRGEPDPIGKFEITAAKETIAYERGSRRTP